MHLTPDELIEIVEGDEPEPASRHLRSCTICRDELSALRTAMFAAAEVDLPEPSPLYWDHLSERVRTAVAAENSAGARHAAWGSGWLPRWSWSTVSVAVAAAAVALAVYLTANRPIPPAAGDDASAVPAIETALLPLGSVDDPSLALVAGLTEQLDAESVTETTWTDHVGAIDEVVFTLTDEERMELQRLLQEALDKRGA